MDWSLHAVEGKHRKERGFYMNNRMKKLAGILLAVMMCVTMMPVGVFAEETGAASGQTDAQVQTQDQTGSEQGQDQSGTQTGDQTQTGTQEQTQPAEPQPEPTPAPAPAPKTRKTFKWYGYNLKFTTKVMAETSLNANSEPLGLKVKVNKKNRKLTWKAPRNAGYVDGFIVLKRTGKKGYYKQYATLGKNARSYVDKKAKKKHKVYYTVVGFKKTEYGIRISPCSGMGRAPGRTYQNPSKYVQISNKISKHGLSYYTAPVLVNSKSTKKDHIEALIKTAYKYKGDRYVVCRSGAPGKGLDCSGLVMQACYGAGVDLWPVNPWRHRLTKYEYESRNIAKMKTLQTVKYKNRKRGDLIFFANSRGTVIHVAIYLGNNKIIHSTSVGNHVVVTGMGGGAYGRVKLVKRIFN